MLLNQELRRPDMRATLSAVLYPALLLAASAAQTPPGRTTSFTVAPTGAATEQSVGEMENKGTCKDPGRAVCGPDVYTYQQAMGIVGRRFEQVRSVVPVRRFGHCATRFNVGHEKACIDDSMLSNILTCMGYRES